jgi:hypothetical protein
MCNSKDIGASPLVVSRIGNEAAKQGTLASESDPKLSAPLNAQDNWIGFTEQSIVYASGTVAIDWSKGNKAILQMGAGNITNLNFTDPPTSGNAQLLLLQDAIGNRLITNWDSDVIWLTSDGNPPVLRTAGNAANLIAFYWSITKSKYYGAYS